MTQRRGIDVGGRFTESSQPLIANDPHLLLIAPSIFYQVHLRVLPSGLDVIGSTFAGSPGIALGHNRHISWGSTTNPIDVTDMYQEQYENCLFLYL